MKVLMMVIYDDHEPGPVPDVIDGPGVLRTMNLALTYGDRHQEYDLTAITLHGWEASMDE